MKCPKCKRAGLRQQVNVFVDAPADCRSLSNSEAEAMRFRKQPVIHHGDPGRGALRCGVQPIGGAAGLPMNWSFTPEKVTCKKCLKLYRAKVARSNP